MIVTESHRAQVDKPVRVGEGKKKQASVQACGTHRRVLDVHTILGKGLIVIHISKN
jgi:hypothetical protein